MTLHRLLPIAFVGFALLGANAAAAEDAWVIKTSPYSVPATVEKLTAAIEGAGAKVVAVVDHAAAASGAGLELPQTTVVIFGNPKIGTPVMAINRQIAIDLPLKVLVWDVGANTMIGYVEPQVLVERFGIASDNNAVQMMTTALDRLTKAAIAE